MGTVAADLGAGQQHLKPKVLFDLFAEFLQRLAKKLFHFAAAKADDVRVLLLHPRLIKMLIAADVHQIEFIHQAALLSAS